MITTVAAAHDFTATHALTVPDHPCTGTHEHGWSLAVAVTGVPDDDGHVVAAAALAGVQRWVLQVLDGKDLDGFVDEQPTMEHLAGVFLDVVHGLLWAGDPEAMRRVTRLAVTLWMGPHLSATVAHDRVDPFLAAEQAWRWEDEVDGA